MLMPQFRNTAVEQATKLDQEASQTFDEGTQARERADQYVRVTSFLRPCFFWPLSVSDSGMAEFAPA